MPKWDEKCRPAKALLRAGGGGGNGSVIRPGQVVGCVGQGIAEQVEADEAGRDGDTSRHHHAGHEYPPDVQCRVGDGSEWQGRKRDVRGSPNSGIPGRFMGVIEKGFCGERDQGERPPTARCPLETTP